MVDVERWIDLRQSRASTALREWISSAFARILGSRTQTTKPGRRRRTFAVDTTGNGPTDKQREKRRGIAAESLVASMCGLGSMGS
jgi:hypothetical protein